MENKNICKTCGHEIKENIIQTTPATKIEWGATCDRELEWEEAKEWCKKQGDGWRLPTRVELLQAFKDKIDGFRLGYYWSNNEYSPTGAWSQYLSTINHCSVTKSNYNYVRCVRDLIS